MRWAKGQVTRVGVTLPGESRQVVLSQVGYYPYGPISGWVFGNGRAVQRTYDKNYRPKQINDFSPGGLAIGFDFDPRGQLTSILPLAGTTPYPACGWQPLTERQWTAAQL